MLVIMEAQSQPTVKENPHGPKVIVIYLLPHPKKRNQTHAKFRV